jgi:hypothetical protein
MADEPNETRTMFLRQIYGFVNNLAELRDFVEVTSSLFQKKRQDDVAKSPEAYVQFLLSGVEKFPKDVKLEDELKRGVAKKFPDSFEIVEVEKTGGEKEIELRAKPGQSFDVAKVAIDFDKSIKREVSLRRSALISLISSCEWFAAQILHYFLQKHPDSAGLGDASLSFDELRTFDSVADAREWVISNKIEGILRGSFEDWIKFFFDKLKIQKNGIDEHIPFCQEACLRRNVLVHNGGIINNIYVNRLPAQIDEGLKVGDQVRVDESYLDDRLDRLEIVFVLVAFEVWRKLDKDGELRLGVAIQLAFDALKSGRWAVARAVASYAFNQKECSESQRLMAKVNYWQSFKWSGDLENVRAEIEEWDISAAGMQFRVAKSILLGDKEASMNGIRVLLGVGELTIDQLNEWPLFQDLRSSGSISTLLREHGNEGKPQLMADNNKASALIALPKQEGGG